MQYYFIKFGHAGQPKAFLYRLNSSKTFNNNIIFINSSDSVEDVCLAKCFYCKHLIMVLRHDLAHYSASWRYYLGHCGCKFWAFLYESIDPSTSLNEFGRIVVLESVLYGDKVGISIE